MENPCPKMEELGYNYNYNKGFVDETPHYTRVEEDRIIYTGHDCNIHFNLGSKTMVIIMHNDNADYYGNKPTFFLNKDLYRVLKRLFKSWDGRNRHIPSFML